MFDYVCQRSLSARSLSSFSVSIIMFFNLFSLCLHGIDSQSIVEPSLKTIFQLRNAQFTNVPPRKSLRIVYFREFNRPINESFLTSDIQNFTRTFAIDFKLNIFDQTKAFSMTKLCSLISQERRDTILVADSYTKEVDLLSRALKLPTIALINRYQLVQGKLVSLRLHSFHS